MLTGLWTIGIKVPSLERELAFHRQMGNEIVLDETLEFYGEHFRLPLVKMVDKYLHLAEKMVYEGILGESLPFGVTHLAYVSNSFDARCCQNHRQRCCRRERGCRGKGGVR